MTALYDAEGRFLSHEPNECGPDSHSSTGYRAWCSSCSSWCYEDIDMACNGCEIAHMRVQESNTEFAYYIVETQNSQQTLWYRIGREFGSLAAVKDWIESIDDPDNRKYQIVEYTRRILEDQNDA